MCTKKWYFVLFNISSSRIFSSYISESLAFRLYYYYPVHITCYYKLLHRFTTVFTHYLSICHIPYISGTLLWANKLKWKNADTWKNSKKGSDRRRKIIEEAISRLKITSGCIGSTEPDIWYAHTRHFLSSLLSFRIYYKPQAIYARD